METQTRSARRFAIRTSARWPSCSAPIVGTSATVVVFGSADRARRSAGSVRTMVGLGAWLAGMDTRSVGCRGDGDGRAHDL